jgi:epoxyqueuosine reductase
MFSGSPIKRIGHARFLRNVLIGIGNSGSLAFLPDVIDRLGDKSPLIRGAAVWALRKLAPEEAVRLKARYLASETDNEVGAEWVGEV